MKLLQTGKRIISLGVATALLLSVTVAGSVYAQSEDEAVKTITAFAQLDEAVAEQSAPLGQARTALNLPETLEGTVSVTVGIFAPEDIADSGAVTQTATERIPIEWTSAPEYSGAVLGEYVFSATPTGGYVLGEGVALPEVTVTVHEPRTTLRSVAKTPITTALLCRNGDTIDKLAEEGWRWDGISHVLTLDGIDLTVSPGLYGISIPGGTVELVPGSENKISLTANNPMGAGLYSSADIVITGAGTLEIAAKSAITTTNSGDIRIDGGTLNLDGEITNSNGNIIFNGGTVNIDTTGSYGVRNNCHAVKINGGTLSITAANAAIATLDGGSISVKSGVNISDNLKTQTARSSAGKNYTSFAENGKTLAYNDGFTNAAKTVTINGADSGDIPPAAVYAVAVKSSPAKTTYTAGDTLDLSGMVISLKRNNGATEDVAFSSFEAEEITTDPEHGAVLTTADSSVTVMLGRIYVKQAITVSAKDSGGDNPGENPGGGDNPGEKPGGGDNPGENPGGGDNPGENPGGGDNPGEKPGGGDNPGENPGGGNNPGGSTGGGSGGGSGNSGSGTTGGGSTGSDTGRLGGTSGNTDKPSSNVSSRGEVKSTDAVRQTAKAVEDAAKAGSAARADVVVKNAQSVSAKTLKDMDASAKKAGGGVQLVADSVVNGKTQARLYIDPALSSTMTSDIKLGVKLDERSTEAVRRSFSSFDNELAVISFDQQGSFGMPLEAAVKVNLGGLDAKNLRFYSYDKASNRYSVIANPEYRIDSNGFLHFKTSAGGDVLISDKPLTPKR